jgi:hypothetical protein
LSAGPIATFTGRAELVSVVDLSPTLHYASDVERDPLWIGVLIVGLIAALVAGFTLITWLS